MNRKIKNIAIIAHVDHGKTTFVDSVLKQTVGNIVGERVMDSNDLERERGITILAKCTAIFWKDFKINIVDTPGHADFGGEVERALFAVEGILLLVDSVEKVQPQTQYVLRKALEKNKTMIVVVNKMDRENADPQQTLDEIYDLVLHLAPDNSTNLDFPVFYGSGKLGYMCSDVEKAKNREINNMNELLDTIVETIPEYPVVTADKPLRAVVFMLDSSDHFGKMLICKIIDGRIKQGETLHAIEEDGKVRESFRLIKMFEFHGTKKNEIQEASVGDIVVLVGATDSTVNHTISNDPKAQPVEVIKVDEPTLSVLISVNTSPLCGKEGDKLTFAHIKERMLKEAETNVGLNISQSGEAFEVFARGELQIAVLVENMRREGFELTIKSPRVLIKEENGVKMEPSECLTIDAPVEYMGVILDKLTRRGAILVNTVDLGYVMKMEFSITTRALMGYFSEFMSDTRGTGVINRRFDKYVPCSEAKKNRINGIMVSMVDGVVTDYALDALQDRGVFFVSPGEVVYKGMIIGEHNRESDLDVNPTKEKKLTNVRASGKDDAIKLAVPRTMKLEDSIAYIAGNEGEGIEVTPKHIRLRRI